MVRYAQNKTRRSARRSGMIDMYSLKAKKLEERDEMLVKSQYKRIKSMADAPDRFVNNSLTSCIAIVRRA